MSDLTYMEMKQMFARDSDKLKAIKLQKKRELKADTEELVEWFSAALLAKLRAAEIKYKRKDDWARDDWKADCQRKLLEHVAKGDPLDVAAYAAFCWFHGWRTSK